MDHNLLNDQQYREKVDLLLELIGNINSNLELKSVLLHIIEAAMKITDSEASSVYLLDETKNELILTVPTGPISEKIHGRRFPVTNGIAGWVARNSESQIVNDVSKDDRFYGDFEPEIFTTRNILCVPLKNQSEEVIGVLQALNKKEDAQFDESEISLFQVLAHQAAIAITNARLLEERKTLLSEIHHRVKNNMAIISGMIHIQAYNEKDEAIQNKLLNSVTRISSMATVHEQLYEAHSFSSLDFAENLEKLIANIIDTVDFHRDISTVFQCDKVMLNVNQSIPCSLIVSEIIFHLLKFGFQDTEHPEIQIRLSENADNETIILDIEDNGRQTDRYFSDVHKDGHDSGFQLIEVLCKQLEAKCDYRTKSDKNIRTLRFRRSDKAGSANKFL
ncbi:histidine kinase dimerization/phosphoacceptor domain -containing protein [Rhodohalobacter sp. 614A]|uniref:histidine kinase dimerization/phosphoacceptor domain -containing protein n=1 Tax=Rhodohalobacter sp. 614A TaxID=2908649 RepID=UPI001F340CE6|nr:histidine kinase dimerization/phosphoacceptor domain -containing protein [Rhodohalobacter sp. 614A]